MQRHPATHSAWPAGTNMCSRQGSDTNTVGQVGQGHTWSGLSADRRAHLRTSCRQVRQGSGAQSGRTTYCLQSTQRDKTSCNAAIDCHQSHPIPPLPAVIRQSPAPCQPYIPSPQGTTAVKQPLLAIAKAPVKPHTHLVVWAGWCES